MPGKYREVFTAEPGEQQDPGRIFYTITAADIGRSTIQTTAGPVHLSDWFGRIRACDIGKRLYRIPADGGIEGQPVTWAWQAENDRQRDGRLLRNAHACGRHCGPGYHPDEVTVRLIEQNETRR